ncbi:thioesterase II family protein [Saccharothrix deserti]|uniref:thioesterase II family protein n=1 Tax=Saccharothrix deserti TaxID=2593674 RepID=UPI00192E3A5B|nr:alpha/beta fold hydrolase [Saccharothrix deserti]
MRAANARSNWLMSFAEVPDPVYELVCLPHAGGGGSVFGTWQQHTDRLRISAVRLPGRERRFAEPAIADLTELVESLAGGLEPVVTATPYALYGHSMGALVAFEAARELRRRGLPQPAALFVAGCEAPHLVDFERVHDLPREELIAWLMATDGLEPEAFQYPELIDMMLPTIRADLGAAERYSYRPEPPLSVPIHLLRGRADDQMSVDGTSGWDAHTSLRCAVTDFDGGHFFVREHEPEVVRLIEAELCGRGGAK